jgi:hypothetical protein
MLASATIGAEPPEWAHAEGQPRASAWLTVGDLTFPLRQGRPGELVAATVIAPGGLPNTTRARRNRTAKAKRARRSTRGRSLPAGRPDAAPDSTEWD